MQTDMPHDPRDAEPDAASAGDGHPRDAAARPGDRTYDSGRLVGWDGLVVERHSNGRPGEIEVPGLKQHRACVLLNTGPNATSERRAWGGLDREGPFAPGGVALIGAGQAVRWRWDAKPPTIVVKVAHYLLVRAADEAGMPNPDRVELRAALRAEAPAVRRIAIEMAAEFAAPGAASRLYVEALATQLSVVFLRDHATAPPRPDPKSARRPLPPNAVRRAEAHLRERLAENVSMDDLAAAAGCGRFQLFRRFKKATGESPHQYQLRLRLERARELLASGSRRQSVASVAAECGFFDQSHLARHFRRIYGVPPGQLLDRRGE